MGCREISPVCFWRVNVCLGIGMSSGERQRMEVRNRVAFSAGQKGRESNSLLVLLSFTALYRGTKPTDGLQMANRCWKATWKLFFNALVASIQTWPLSCCPGLDWDSLGTVWCESCNWTVSSAPHSCQWWWKRCILEKWVSIPGRSTWKIKKLPAWM